MGIMDYARNQMPQEALDTAQAELGSGRSPRAQLVAAKEAARNVRSKTSLTYSPHMGARERERAKRRAGL